MKKIISLLLALSMILAVAVCAHAETPENTDNQTSDISSEANATAKKEEEQENEAATKGSSSSMGDLIRFIPVTINVLRNEVTVDGYFLNLNDVAVRNFKSFEMDVYRNNQLISSGYFGDINSFTVYPRGVYRQSFTFRGPHNLNTGHYVCDDLCYAVCSFRFSA